MPPILQYSLNGEILFQHSRQQSSAIVANVVVTETANHIYLNGRKGGKWVEEEMSL